MTVFIRNKFKSKIDLIYPSDMRPIAENRKKHQKSDCLAIEIFIHFFLKSFLIFNLNLQSDRIYSSKSLAPSDRKSCSRKMVLT